MTRSTLASKIFGRVPAENGSSLSEPRRGADASGLSKRGYFSLVALLAAFTVVASGCASLPDVKRLEGNMDAMVYYMGVMAGSMPGMVHSTGRMADMAERMERKTDSLLGDIQKKGGSAERTIQNYSQAILDNDRAMIKNLKGIREELGDFRHSLAGPRPTTAGPQDQARVNQALQSRLSDLEARLSSIAAKMENLEKKAPH